MVNPKDNKNTTQLYWLAEELKAYTDLTGDRFDIDNAKRRLFPMESTIEKMDLPKVQELYDELTVLLDVPMFFDKMAFADKVEELYQLLERHASKNNN